MKIYIRTLTGKTLELEIGEHDTVMTLMERIHEIEGSTPCQQRVIFAGKQLEEEKRLSDYNIRPESTIRLVLNLRGAKPVILLYDNEKKVNEEVIVKLTLNDAMDIGATYPQPTVTNENSKGKEYEWKCSYSSDGSEDACQLTVNGKNYEYLFWEGICNRKEDFEEGEVVGISKEKFVDELEELLGKLGLNEREINDFIVYWLTKLSNRKGHKVTICAKKYDNEIAQLKVDGFVQIHRVMLMFEEVDLIDGMKSVEDVVRDEFIGVFRHVS